MKDISSIGLSKAESDQLAEKLNHLLANYQVFYMNVRGFHWNIRGEKFFELHLKFEELYNNLVLKIDEIAERVLTIGGRPMHSYQGYLAESEIMEVTDTSEGRACVASILDSFRILLIREREILQLSGEMADEGTNALMSDYIREKEKLVWMYSAYLNT